MKKKEPRKNNFREKKYTKRQLYKNNWLKLIICSFTEEKNQVFFNFKSISDSYKEIGLINTFLLAKDSPENQFKSKFKIGDILLLDSEEIKDFQNSERYHIKNNFLRVMKKNFDLPEHFFHPYRRDFKDWKFFIRPDKIINGCEKIFSIHNKISLNNNHKLNFDLNCLKNKSREATSKFNIEDKEFDNQKLKTICDGMIFENLDMSDFITNYNSNLIRQIKKISGSLFLHVDSFVHPLNFGRLGGSLEIGDFFKLGAILFQISEIRLELPKKILIDSNFELEKKYLEDYQSVFSTQNNVDFQISKNRIILKEKLKKNYNIGFMFLNEEEIYLQIQKEKKKNDVNKNSDYIKFGFKYQKGMKCNICKNKIFKEEDWIPKCLDCPDSNSDNYVHRKCVFNSLLKNYYFNMTENSISFEFKPDFFVCSSHNKNKIKFKNLKTPNSENYATDSKKNNAQKWSIKDVESIIRLPLNFFDFPEEFRQNLFNNFPIKNFYNFDQKKRSYIIFQSTNALKYKNSKFVKMNYKKELSATVREIDESQNLINRIKNLITIVLFDLDQDKNIFQMGTEKNSTILMNRYKTISAIHANFVFKFKKHLNRFKKEILQVKNQIDSKKIETKDKKIENNVCRFSKKFFKFRLYDLKSSYGSFIMLRKFMKIPEEQLVFSQDTHMFRLKFEKSLNLMTKH